MSEDKNFKEKAEKILNDVKDDSKSFDKKEIESGKGMAVLAYIIPLIPYFVEKENKFVKYHATQGMNLFIIAIAYSIIYGVLTSLIRVKQCAYYYCYSITPWWVTLPLSLIGLCITILCIIGIVNVCNGKAKELPVVNKLKIFK